MRQNYLANGTKFSILSHFFHGETEFIIYNIILCCAMKSLCKTSNTVKESAIGIENKNTNCKKKTKKTAPPTKGSASFYATHAHSLLQL